MRALLKNVVLVAIAAVALAMPLAAAPSVTDAAMRGDKAAVRALLSGGADVNAAQGDGMTALHWAALLNDVDLARMLLHAGANVRATTRLDGYTPLLLAAKDGHIDVMRELIAAGADPNAATGNGATPLMFAAAAGKPDGVILLLEHGATANARDIKGETALMFAAANGRADAIPALTGRGADVKLTTRVVNLMPPPDAKTEPAKADAPKAPRPSVTSGGAYNRDGEPRDGERLGRAGGNPRFNALITAQGGLTALLFAARQGYVDTVKSLLTSGADINQPSAGDKTTPLLIATINGHFDLAKMLLDQGADPNLASENGVTPLYAVVNIRWAQKAAYPQPRAGEQQRLTYLELMTALLDKGADPNMRINKKPWYAGYNFDQSGIEEAGATPFWRAAYASDIEAMRLLVSRGADPRIPTMKLAETAAEQRAARSAGGRTADESGLPPVPPGGPDASALLAASGVGYTIIGSAKSHRFAATGMLAAVKYLVEELHLDPTAIDAGGNNAIHYAASRGDNEMIQYLVSKGANPLQVNRLGFSTVDMANAPYQSAAPFPETIALLEKMGAKNNHRCLSC